MRVCVCVVVRVYSVAIMCKMHAPYARIAC